MTGHRVGYKRVSSVEQNPDRQLESMMLDRVFIDKVSGKDRKRPHLEEMKPYVRDGDTVVVHSMDSLARNLDDLRELVQLLTSNGLKVEFVKECLTFTADDARISQLLLFVMGAF